MEDLPTVELRVVQTKPEPKVCALNMGEEDCALSPNVTDYLRKRTDDVPAILIPYNLYGTTGFFVLVSLFRTSHSNNHPGCPVTGNVIERITHHLSISV